MNGMRPQICIINLDEIVTLRMDGKGTINDAFRSKIVSHCVGHVRPVTSLVAANEKSSNSSLHPNTVEACSYKS